MPFICYIAGDRRVWHTVHDRQRTQDAYDAGGKGALLCVCCREPVYPRNRGTRHVVHWGKTRCPLRQGAGTEHHQQIQYALVRIGRSLGEEDARLEYPVLDGKYRFDVDWPRAGIAWEVDLSQNTEAEQCERQRVRRDHHRTMISVVARRNKNQAPEIPTVLISTLPKAETQFPLENQFVGNVHRWVEADGSWPRWDKMRFVTFARAVVGGALVYSESPLGKHYGWTGSGVEVSARRVEDLGSTLRSKEAELRVASKRLSDREREAQDCAVTFAFLEALADEVRQPPDARKEAINQNSKILTIRDQLPTDVLQELADDCTASFPGLGAIGWRISGLFGRAWSTRREAFVKELTAVTRQMKAELAVGDKEYSGLDGAKSQMELDAQALRQRLSECISAAANANDRAVAEVGKF